MANQQVIQPALDRDANRAAPSSLPDLNAETYPFHVVQELLDQAACFNLFSIPDPRCPSVALDGGAGGVIGFRIAEILHRFDVTVPPPSFDSGLRAANRVGEALGRFDHRWIMIPDNYAALPGVEPSRTILDPSRPQRFVMLDSVCSFNDGKDGFRGFGTGSTFPLVLNGRRQLLAAAVGEILEGFGRFAGHRGTYTYCGSLSQETGFRGNLLCRVMDPQDDFASDGLLPETNSCAGQDDDVTYILIRGQKKDKYQKTSYRFGPDNQVIGLNVEQQLRLVQVDASAGRRGLLAAAAAGPVVGRMTSRIDFNLFHPGAPGTSLAPIPFQSYNQYTFFDPDGCSIGTIAADGAEGRTFNLTLAGAPGQSALRFGGFGPLLASTGRFEGIQGLMTDNSVVGIAPHALATLYVLRIHDPDGKYRIRLHVGGGRE